MPWIDTYMYCVGTCATVAALVVAWVGTLRRRERTRRKRAWADLYGRIHALRQEPGLAAEAKAARQAYDRALYPEETP